MAKEILKTIKVEIPAGQANPSPPLGPALGQAGVNIGEFVNQFNSATQDMGGEVIPVEITVYEDRSFDFTLKTTPAARMLLKAANAKKGAGKNLVSKAGTVTKDQVREIAEYKLPDLNTNDVDQAMNTIEGTARSMGIAVKES